MFLRWLFCSYYGFSVITLHAASLERRPEKPASVAVSFGLSRPVLRGAPASPAQRTACGAVKAASDGSVSLFCGQAYSDKIPLLMILEESVERSRQMERDSGTC